MRYICTNKCDISPFGNCVATETEIRGPAYCNSDNKCIRNQVPTWTVFDEMGEERSKKQSENFQWFLENYKQLYLIHGTCYLVIVDKAIAYTAQTFADAYAWVIERQIPIYNIQYNNGTPDGYTVYNYTFWEV